jgi:hypothetical protein
MDENNIYPLIQLMVLIGLIMIGISICLDVLNNPKFWYDEEKQICLNYYSMNGTTGLSYG